MLVAERPQRTQELGWHDAHHALAHDRLDQDRRGCRADRAPGGRQIAKWHLVEAIDHRAEAFEVFLLTSGGECRQRAAMKGAVEGDDAVTFRLAIRRMELARG